MFNPDKTKIAKEVVSIADIADPDLDELVSSEHADQLRNDVELIEGVYEPWDAAPYLEGQLAPVFFGSAVNNFGIQEMLDTFIDIAPDPRPRSTDVRGGTYRTAIHRVHFQDPREHRPRHRDRIAFMRICSGKFSATRFTSTPASTRR